MIIIGHEEGPRFSFPRGVLRKIIYFLVSFSSFQKILVYNNLTDTNSMLSDASKDIMTWKISVWVVSYLHGKIYHVFMIYAYMCTDRYMPVQGPSQKRASGSLICDSPPYSFVIGSLSESGTNVAPRKLQKSCRYPFTLLFL